MTLTGANYEKYLKYQASKQSSSIVASIAHSSNLVTCPSLLSHFTNATSLPLVTLANRPKIVVKVMPRAHPLLSLSLDFVLYILNCLFNLVFVNKLTRSLHCSITFDNESVIIQDRGTRWMIGIGRESQGLYHLNLSSAPIACIVSESPALLHNRLGHPCLLKLHKMVSSLSNLQSLSCEFCQLEKHFRSLFPKRVNK